MAVFIDVKSRFDDASGRKAAEDAKRYFGRAGTDSGQDFTSNFAKAVERDTKVRAAADKVANQLDKITAAEAKRATQLEKSKAINDAVAASEEKLTKARADGNADEIAAAEQKLVSLREKQIDINNKLVVSSTAVSTAERSKARAVREAGDAYKKMGDDVDTLGSKLANLGSAGGALKLNLGLAALGTLPAAATAITEVAGALQQLAGAGFAVPGIFAGIASSVAVGALGMHGMSDAITAVSKASDGTKSSVEAANKALAALPASSADVVKTVVGLKGTFTDLQNVASTNMFSGVSAGIKGLVAADLPAVTRGIDGISRGINQNLLQAMTSLGSSSSQGFLDRIFGNTADAQSKLSGAIDPIVHAVGTLTAAGSDTLPRLADAIGAVATRFDNFISGADADGRLQKWIDEGLTGFTQLGNTALNIGKSFTALTEAAGGGTGLLGTLESATAKMSSFLNSTEGQSKLRDFFAEGRDMLSQLKDVATSAGPVLAGVFQSGIGAANLWLPVIKQALNLINAIPGGAATAVAAFATWKTVTGVASLITSLTKIGDLLNITLPNSAAAGVGKMSLSLDGLIGKFGLVAAAAAAAYSVGQNNPNMNPNIPNPDGSPKIDVNNMKPGDKFGVDANGNMTVIPAAPATPSAVPTNSGSSADPSWTPFGTKTAGGRGTYRTRDGLTRAIPGPSTPGVPSSFTDPVITDSGSGSDKTPFIDPSKYMMGDPLAGMPAAVAGADPQKVYEADSTLITATHNMEQKKLALQVLEAKGNATQQELLTAKNDLQEQERTLYDAQFKDVQARTNQMKQATSDLQSVFAPLDQDFGISKGLPGVVENLTKMFGNMALAGVIGSSPQLQAAAIAMQSEKTGVGAPNASNNAAIGQRFFGSGSGGLQPGMTGLPAGVSNTHGSHPQIAQIAAIAKSFGLEFTAGKDDHAADGGFHPKGMAGDFSNSQGNSAQELAFANYMAQNFGSSLQELIYSDPQFSQLIGGGKNVSGGTYYSPGTLADHTNHVHVAMTDQAAGALGGGAAAAMPSSGGGSGSKQDVASMILQQATARGYSAHDAQSILAYAIGESGLDPGISGGPQGGSGAADTVIGLFQQKPGFASAGGIDPSQRSDPYANTHAYLNQLEAHRDLPIEQALPATSVGGPLAQGPGSAPQAWGSLMDQAGAYMSTGGGASGSTMGASGPQPSAAFGGGGLPIPLPVTIVGGLGGLPAPAGTPASGVGLGPPPGPVAPVTGTPASGTGLGSPPGPLPAIPAGAGGEGYMGLGGPPMAPNIGPGPLQPDPFPIPGAGPGALPPSGNNPFAGPYSAAPSPAMAGLDPNSPTGLGRAPGAVGPFPTPASVAPAPAAPGGPAGFSTGVQPGANPQGGGAGIMPGGMIDSAIGAAAMGLDVMAPGAGQAAQIGIKLANRAIQYGAQAAGIGVSGLMETFLPAGSPLAAGSWFSKVASGIAGARPAGQNKSGGPNGGAPPGQSPPPMPAGDQHTGSGAAPGPTNNIVVNNQRATEDGTGRDVQAALMAQNSGPGR